MSSVDHDIDVLHGLINIIENVDVGLIVINRSYNVKIWNGFMANHSGLHLSHVNNRSLFELFPEIEERWLKKKIDSVFLLNNRAFSTWHQRPYLIKFDSYHPITGDSEWMYQNMTIFPMGSTTGEINHVCITIYDVTEIALDEQALYTANEELEHLGRTDGLTQLNNRRFWEESLAAEYKRNQRSGNNSSLVMFDIDHFKKVNDTYGHQAGDKVIETIASILRDQNRETDIAGRYGGEEFSVILVDTDREGAFVFAERLRQAVEKTEIRHDESSIRCTISLGVAEMTFDGVGYKVWLEHADLALYKSKSDGRNRSTIYS